MSMKRISYIILAAFAVAAYAGETDQFLTWGIELEDAAPAFNEYLNSEIAAFLESDTARAITLQSDLAEAIYLYLFNGLHQSRVRDWLQNSPDIQRYPDNSVSWWRYHSQSIYNRLSFPYFLPLSRTIRVGDVYTGIDKFGHFFGFGRRFYIGYARYRADGLSDREAREAVVRDGITSENLFVGKLVDGIFSSADIEAGYQGMLLCQALADPSAGYITKTDDRWVLVERIDMRDYVTPEFDESYNPCHYWALRKRFVIPKLRERYGEQVASEHVRQRFRRYRAHPPSFCMEIIAHHFDEQTTNPQRAQFQAAFGIPYTEVVNPIHTP